MQIVIDIPEACFNDIKRNRYLYEEDNEFLAKQIANGIPLPKGHGDLIDRDMCLKMKCRDLVDADGVTMYAVPTGNILRMKPVIPADKEGADGSIDQDSRRN